MPNWEKLPLSCYTAATLPYRWCANFIAARRGLSPIILLYYHRIADDAASPWTMSNAMFQQQMNWLRRRYDMVSIEEAQQRIRNDNNSRIAVHITFDDGYADNCQQAIPFLLEHGIPCTYFVSSWFVLNNGQFPHDKRLGVVSRPNTLAELEQMAAAGIEIGSHTRTHADLGRINDPRRLYDEVVGSGEDLQSALGRQIRYFAFPYGLPDNLNSLAYRLADEHGYEGICSAYGGYNLPGGDPFHLERFHVEDMPRLKNWVTVDPRRILRPYHFDYQGDLSAAVPTGALLT